MSAVQEIPLRVASYIVVGVLLARQEVSACRMKNDIVGRAAAATLGRTNSALLRNAGDLCFLAGVLSIAGSIAAWGVRRASANEGHAERLGIFVGLWAPTFFILSNRFERYAERRGEK